MIKRRSVLRLFGAAPLAAMGGNASAVTATAQDRASHHWQAFVDAMNELTSEGDGWIVTGGAKVASNGDRPAFINASSIRYVPEMIYGKEYPVERHFPLALKSGALSPDP
jgi:hypothetical protein